MDVTVTAKPRSKRVITMLDYLLAVTERGEYATAAELATITGLPSKWIYPMLKWWIERRVVESWKVLGKRVYRLNPRLAKNLKRILRMVLRARELRATIIAKILVERILRRRLTGVEEALVQLLVEKLYQSSSPYIRLRARTLREALDILMVKLEPMLREKGVTLYSPSSIEEALEELSEAGIIYFRFERGMLLLRLDKMFESKLQEYTS